MRQLNLAQFERDRDYSVWPIDFAMSASFELPVARLQELLPPRIHPMEPRPGLGLLNLSVFSFAAGAGRLSQPCVEIVASAHVMPNLALAPVLPRLSMYTFRLAATTREFIESEYATDRYRVFPDRIHVHIDRQRIAVDVSDEAGNAIFTLAAAEGVTPRYEDDRFYMQSSTTRDGELYVGGNLFEFRRAENQRNLQTAGAPAPHPFFGELDLSGISSKQGYLQMWSEPGGNGCETHFFLKSAYQ